VQLLRFVAIYLFHEKAGDGHDNGDDDAKFDKRSQCTENSDEKPDGDNSTDDGADYQLPTRGFEVCLIVHETNTKFAHFLGWYTKRT
jgi:hypothetical protein